ncbi:DUF5074 domain-containing protein [Mucilaginibacter gynuensis]|uniref:DUF5074 domain-containing protein n=1 Tax=Mucilaginibacter gynuensis TaxID=1302236 RepID=A0ABP8FXT5_9SPHI
MINITTLKRSTALVAAFALALASCTKDHNDAISIVKPGLSVKNGADTITLGNPLTLRPKLAERTGVTYTWAVDGKSVGTDSIYTFNPADRGDYKVSFTASNTAGKTSAEYQIHVWGKYENGFFLVNEGWFGHGTGTVNFYRYDTKTLEDSVYTKENPGKTLDPKTSTLENGTIFNGKLYLSSKVGGPVVVTDAYSLKETGRIASAGGNDWRAFVGVDNTNGLITSGNGVYKVNLSPLTLGAKVAGISGEIADVIKAGNYIFLLSQTEGVLVLNAGDYSIAKKIPNVSVAFAKTPDGTVWCAGGKSLIKINPANLETQTIAVPFDVHGSWGAWHPGSITASTKANVVYLAKNGPWSGGTTIYKYDGSASSLNNAFITLPAGKELYGAGLGYNTRFNHLIVTTVQSGYGVNYSFNNVYFHDATTGSLKKDLAYRGYFFPAMPLSQQ